MTCIHCGKPVETCPDPHSAPHIRHAAIPEGLHPSPVIFMASGKNAHSCYDASGRPLGTVATT
jgi:hypothetical protein